jgi:hypothetical protein
VNAAQRKLATYVRELAADRQIKPGRVLLALRRGYDSDAESALADRWGVTRPDLVELQMLLNQEPVPPRPPAAPIEDGPISVRTPAAQPEPVDPERAAFTAGMRQIADFLDQHPAVQLPFLIRTDRSGLPTMWIYLFGDVDRSQLAAATEALAAGGHQVHEAGPDDDPALQVWRAFGGIALEVRSAPGWTP